MSDLRPAAEELRAAAEKLKEEEIGDDAWVAAVAIEGYASPTVARIVETCVRNHVVALRAQAFNQIVEKALGKPLPHSRCDHPECPSSQGTCRRD